MCLGSYPECAGTKAEPGSANGYGLLIVIPEFAAHAAATLKRFAAFHGRCSLCWLRLGVCVRLWEYYRYSTIFRLRLPPPLSVCRPSCGRCSLCWLHLWVVRTPMGVFPLFHNLPLALPPPLSVRWPRILPRFIPLAPMPGACTATGLEASGVFRQGVFWSVRATASEGIPSIRRLLSGRDGVYGGRQHHRSRRVRRVWWRSGMCRGLVCCQNRVCRPRVFFWDKFNGLCADGRARCFAVTAAHRMAGSDVARSGVARLYVWAAFEAGVNVYTFSSYEWARCRTWHYFPLPPPEEPPPGLVCILLIFNVPRFDMVRPPSLPERDMLPARLPPVDIRF